MNTRAVFRVEDNKHQYHMCDVCISETFDVVRTLRSIISRDDSKHCLSCDYQAEDDCACVPISMN